MELYDREMDMDVEAFKREYPNAAGLIKRVRRFRVCEWWCC